MKHIFNTPCVNFDTWCQFQEEKVVALIRTEQRQLLEEIQKRIVAQSGYKVCEGVMLEPYPTTMFEALSRELDQLKAELEKQDDE